MNMDPEPQKALARTQGSAVQRAVQRREIGPVGRTVAYTQKPDFGTEGSPNKETPRKRFWLPWAAVAAAVALTFGGWHWWHPVPKTNPGPLILQTVDIDQAATANAREMLARGEIPPALAHADAETRRAVAEGRESLYTKQLLPPDAPAGLTVRVTVTEGGMQLGEDLLTAEHPIGVTFPARNDAPVHFHFSVESAGPKGIVTCWVRSLGGQTVYTAPLPTGGQADLEAIAQ